jgi:hypothetical protein
MELSAEEQSFFDAGDAIDSPLPEQTGAPRSHRVRRRSRHSMSRQIRRQLRRSGWRKTTVSLILTVAAVCFGYWASMLVANRDLPDPTELGVQGRGR